MTSKRASKRGVALITAIFFGILCLAVAVGFLLQVPVDLAAVASRERQVKGSYIADAGIQDTMAWISHELGQAQEPCTISDPAPSRSGTLGDWQWTCLVEPDSGTPPNSLSDYRVYKLTSAASRDGEKLYEVETVVQAGQSFSRFSMFIDEDDASLWDFGVSLTSRIRGPVHKNAEMRINVGSGMYPGGPPPTETPFDGPVTTTAANHVWGGLGQPSTGQWEHIFKNGLSDLEFNTPDRPLPSGSSLLSNAAWGGTTPSAPPSGVSVNPTGGIFISGDVDVMRMEVNGLGRFVLRIIQSGQVTTVEEDAVGAQRIVTLPDGSISTVPNVGSGVIFATGSILDLQGKNKGAHTIAVDFDTGKNIEISGSITRQDTPVGSEPTVVDDRLGLVGQHVYIASEGVLPRSLSTPLYLYATILATERLEVLDPASGNPGAMAIFGGYAGKRTWRVCNSAASGQVLTGYGGLLGYGTPNLNYDKLLANSPPPQYPTTAGTELTVRSWNERSF